MGTRTATGLVLLIGLTAPLVQAAALDQEHTLFGRVLAAHVHDGRVDYANLKRARGDLDAYRAQVAEVTEPTLRSWSREQQLAFWINAYNASVLATIVDRHPLSRGTLVGIAFPANSIWQVPGAFKEPRHRVAGRMRSLDDIEHGIVRPTFAEPRVHLALVCAARGCPPLRSEAFVGARLSAQLDDQVRRFLADTNHGLTWDRGARRIAVSRIFKWFAEDFSAAGGVRLFLASHVTDASLAAALRDPANKLDYLAYDWTLNEP